MLFFAKRSWQVKENKVHEKLLMRNEAKNEAENRSNPLKNKGLAYKPMTFVYPPSKPIAYSDFLACLTVFP
jgi:hypothetical protein